MKMRLIMLFLVLLNFYSCDKHRVYEKNVDIENKEWLYSKKISFVVDIDSTLNKNLYINLRHSQSFESRNILILLESTSPSGVSEQFDLNLNISQPNGKWFGSCSGDICLVRIPIEKLSDYRFKENGIYTFELQQNMRVNPLLYINSVGLRVENVSIK